MAESHKKRLTYKTLFQLNMVLMTILIIGIPLLMIGYVNSAWFQLTTDTGQSPQTPQQLIKGLNISHLKPGQEVWYVYHSDSLTPAEFEWISLAMRYQSKGVFSAEQVNFEVVPSHQLKSSGNNGSKGTLVRTAQQNLNELYWTGKTTETDPYYVRVYNNSSYNLDYTLEANVEQPAFSGAIPASFSDTPNAETEQSSPAKPINTRQLSWQLTALAVEHMSAEQAATWLYKAQAVGWISPQGVPQQLATPTKTDPALLWQLAGQAIAGQDAEMVLEWLSQADALGWLAVPPGTLKDVTTDLPSTDVVNEPPPPTKASTKTTAPLDIPPQVEYSPVSIYPNNPLTFEFNKVNSGRLAPYGVHWYDLQLNDPKDEEWIENLALTMFTTPSNGFIDSRVNFEIIPGNQAHIWQRGTPNDMEHFGLGMWLSRDEDDNTGERLWSGSVVDGNHYLVKVKNASPVEVDYYLFAGDIENAELGNPNLHEEDGSLVTSSLTQPVTLEK